MASPVLPVPFLIFALSCVVSVSAVEKGDLDSMLNALRASGYELFSDSIATSELIFEVLSGESFTFFAPTDSALFALYMTGTASNYITTLRCHIVPLRISHADLRIFPSGSNYFPTLFNKAKLCIPRLRFTKPSHDFITVDRVAIAFPGLFYSPNVAVHGLGGIINCNSDDQLSAPDLQQGNQPLPLDISSHVESPSSENVLDAEAQFFPSESPSPTSRQIHKNTIETPDREPPADCGSAPACSVEQLHFPLKVSPAYGLWPHGMTPATFAAAELSKAPEFSDNDYPVSFPPSSMLTTEQLSPLNKKVIFFTNAEEEENQLQHYTPVIRPEDLDGIMETFPEESRPFEQEGF